MTARSYAQTLELLELHGIEAEVFGRHGGRSRLERPARSLPGSAPCGTGRAVGGSIGRSPTARTSSTITAHRLGIPSATTFDYEFAWLQHQLGLRAATHVVVPEAIPPDRLARYGVRPPKLRQYEGLKEEYYLADFEPDRSAAEALSLDPDHTLVVVRTPPDVSLYHRRSNPLFPHVLEHLGRHDHLDAVVLPRTKEQGDYVRSLDLPAVVVPKHAVDAQSLIALSDLVVSAGGTMNREAAALGVPVYTTFGGRLGGVDEELIRRDASCRSPIPARSSSESVQASGRESGAIPRSSST